MMKSCASRVPVAIRSIVSSTWHLSNENSNSRTELKTGIKREAQSLSNQPSAAAHPPLGGLKLSADGLNWPDVSVLARLLADWGTVCAR